MGKNKIYIRKRQITRIAYIMWICAKVYRRLEKEIPKTKEAQRRLEFEKKIFYKLWEICDNAIEENDKVLDKRLEQCNKNS